ncbi:MAG: trypsin-like serine protease [Polyangiaceae bacterium]
MFERSRQERGRRDGQAAVRGAGRAALALAAALAAACSSQAPVTADDDLVGGTEARDGDFPSTMVVRSNCTVAKVGPRHVLTAAHCVFDESRGEVRAEFQPGATMYVSSAANVDNTVAPEAAGYRAVTIAKVHVPGVFFEESVQAGWPRVLSTSAAPDVAVMEITAGSASAIDDIPEAAIDLSPARPGDRVVIMGYGCEKGVSAEKDYSRVRLKTQATRLVGVEATVHEGSYVQGVETPFGQNLAAQYVFTPGQGAEAEQASLCPGDSGGPVYRDDGRAKTIIGVNAYYSFADASVDPDRVSKTNWHTRLDGASRFDVGAWLAELGVRTVGGPASDHHAACATSGATGRSMCGSIRRYVDGAGGEAAFGAPTTEARMEKDDAGAWRWTQRFARKEVVEIDGVVTVRGEGPDARCAGVSSDGSYCGASLGDPDARALYRCRAGAVVSRTLCDDRCEVHAPGTPDACAAPAAVDPCSRAGSGDGRYCGASLGDGDPGALYQCRGKVTFAKTSCPSGCKVERAGVPDRCL